MTLTTGRPAVLLDRDGTINEQMGYVNHLSRFQLLPGVARAIRSLNEAGLPVVVVTNQSGLARGYFPESLLDHVHAELHRLLAREGAHLDGLYVCPHHPEAREERFRLDCDCRKPRPGMLREAIARFDIDPMRSLMIGDKQGDLDAATAAGVPARLLREQDWGDGLVGMLDRSA